MLRVLTADNPSPLTGPGTNTFLIGRDEIAIIDPGPDDPRHRAAILDAIGAGRVVAILVTHAHLDHSAGARALAMATDAPVMAYGAASAGRSPLMAGLQDSDTIGGGEGLDHGFRPDLTLGDGQTVAGAGWALQALWTPGHCGNHLSFLWDDVLFCGDLILGWSSTLISPPDGDLADYLRSLHRLSALPLGRLMPAHGGPVDNPAGRIAALLHHRRQRSAQIMAALSAAGPCNAQGLAAGLYNVPAALLPAAARNVFAHLLAMYDLGVLGCEGPILADAVFRIR